MKQTKGLIHIYYGSGAGKSTAAFGLALRAAGWGKKVVIVQFLKSTDCGEVRMLRGMENIKIYRGHGSLKFSINMTEEEKQLARCCHNKNLLYALSLIKEGKYDLLVLDEVLDAAALDLLESEELRTLMQDETRTTELVLTGHTKVDWMFDLADYITRMEKEKHPYDEGLTARKGIEF